MNIFKTFEIFLREPISILRNAFVQIVGVQSGSSSSSFSVSAELLNNGTQITVVNSDKVYNLLRTAIYKQKLKEEGKLLPRVETQMVIGQLTKRQ